MKNGYTLVFLISDLRNWQLFKIATGLTADCTHKTLIKADFMLPAVLPNLGDYAKVLPAYFKKMFLR